MTVVDIIKRPFRSFDGTKWIKHYFEISADQVKCRKKDGTESDVQAVLEEGSIFLLAHPVGAVYLSINKVIRPSACRKKGGAGALLRMNSYMTYYA